MSCRKDNPKPFRGWINCPSTLDPYHDYHGRRVLVVHLSRNDIRAYFMDDGDEISIAIDPKYVAKTWPILPKENKCHGRI